LGLLDDYRGIDMRAHLARIGYQAPAAVSGGAR
jgi:hypothetical protein